MSDSTHPHKSQKDSANALDRLDKIGSAFESFNSAESTAEDRNDDLSLNDLNKPLSPSHKSSFTSLSESDFSSSFELDKGLKDLAKIASLSAKDSKAADSKKNASSLSDLEDLIESVDATDQDQDADSLHEQEQGDRVHEAKNLPKVDVASKMASKMDMQNEIAALRKQVLDLTKLSGVIKIDDEAYLNSFDDTIAIDHLKNQRLSICIVAGAGLDTHLIRIADLKSNGLFEAFHKTSASEDSVESIDKIRLADSTVSKGTVGVWSWAISKKATSNHKKGPDSTVSRHQNLIVPTEVVILQDIHSLDELILKIKEGLEYQPISKKVLLTARKVDGNYVGVLCSSQNVSFKNSRIELKEQCSELAVYEFGPQSILSGLIFGHSLHKSAFLGKPNAICPVKTPFEIVKDTVWFSLSWRGLVERELTFKTFDELGEIIRHIPHKEDLTTKVMQSCHCSYEQAQAYLHKFLQEAHEYVSYDTFDDKVILAALSKHGQLQQKACDLLKEQWEQEHQDLIEQTTLAKQELEDVTLLIKNKHAELNKLDADLEHKRSELNLDSVSQEMLLSKIKDEQQHEIAKLKQEHAQEIEKLKATQVQEASKIEQAVSEHIQKAQANAADFVAQMLFIKAAQTALNQGQAHTSLQAPAPQATAQLVAEPTKAATATVAPPVTVATASVAPPVTAATASVAPPANAATASAALQVSSAPLAAAAASHEQAPVTNAAPSSVAVMSMDSRAVDYRLLDCNGKIKAMQERDSLVGIIRVLKSNLKRSGVSEHYAEGLAKYLIAAYMHKQPLILVGPNSLDIIEAFAAAVCHQTYACLTCDDNYSAQIHNLLGAHQERLVVLNNLISSAYIGHLEEILSHKGLFFIATHPYKEDLQVEPKSLYGFMLPIFTEFLVSESASGMYTGISMTNEASLFKLSELEDDYAVSKLNSFAPSPLVLNKVNTLFARMADLMEEDEDECGYKDIEVVLALLPLAYAQMKVNKLEDAIEDPMAPLKISPELTHELQFIFGN
ncbi:MAG: hypothetical protein Q4A68_00585 [Anaerobiospirillum succiniciproducens]|uniref:hypothetical protein n=1 Tax=Anaerobiospirillum succiniciproducens TaxID=13335 RepID=UPI0026DD0E1A|nr:hypothetical protein [Anaerobiospirillum succiniciproducens]MDO4675077.1 hypothetical protein [Anaerobiospirillum succiniciproducens]